MYSHVCMYVYMRLCNDKIYQKCTRIHTSTLGATPSPSGFARIIPGNSGWNPDTKESAFILTTSAEILVSEPLGCVQRCVCMYVRTCGCMRVEVRFVFRVRVCVCGGSFCVHLYLSSEITVSEPWAYAEKCILYVCV